jgi:hypothetical protein
MPTLSASDYTTFLKFKAAAATPIQPAIQTRANVSLSQSVINANILASQAAQVATPFRRSTLPPIITEARTNIITSAVGGTTLITYTTSQEHGLTGTPTISVSGLATGTLSVTPNFTAVQVTVVDATTFTRAVSTNTGSSTGTGSITGLVYYTTAAAHGLAAGTADLTITGIAGTAAFNLTLFSIFSVPSTTTFSVQSSATGTAVTGQTGALTLTTYNNSRSVLTSIGRVVAYPRVTNRSSPDAKSTLSWTSGTSGSVGSLSSSRVNVPGGLPTGFKNSQGTYTRLPQNAGWNQGGAAMLSSGQKRF